MGFSQAEPEARGNLRFIHTSMAYEERPRLYVGNMDKRWFDEESQQVFHRQGCSVRLASS
ncbi:protein of unknown function [Pseudorhizobium banfieldiae]|uniref:Uncharacterized protein n=1 Tax=Pseudorhizobium banfieldiae TaxID=1125847 RepID=L0NMK4_9HYPH|nr:protein of unknown function [Pseudorhizobium banfieldiae]